MHPLEVQDLANRFAIFGRGLAPLAPDRSPCATEPFFISIAVRRNDCGQLLGRRRLRRPLQYDESRYAAMVALPVLMLSSLRCGFLDQRGNLLWSGDVNRVAGT